jgi:hypothetical protein
MMDRASGPPTFTGVRLSPTKFWLDRFGLGQPSDIFFQILVSPPEIDARPGTTARGRALHRGRHVAPLRQC